MTVSHASFSGARLAISLNALHLQATALQVGLLMSLMMVVPTVISVPVGRWGDRAGYLRPTLFGIAGVVLAELVAALGQSLAMLAVTAVLLGTAYTTMHIALNSAIGHVAGPAGRSRVFGLLAVGFSLSALSGPALAGLAIDHFGHAAAFALLAVLPVLALLPLARGAPAVQVHPQEPGASASVRDLWRVPALRAVLLVSAALSVGWDLFIFLMPLHGVRNGLSATLIGLVAASFAVGSGAARLALPWILRRISEWRLMAGALALAAVGYFAMPFCVTAPAMFALALALGMVLGCGQPTIMSLVHQTAPAGRTGEAVGLRVALTTLCQTVLPLGFGALGAVAGVVPMFWLVGALLGIGGGYAALRERVDAGR